MLRTKFIAPVPILTEGWERANGLLEGVVRSTLAQGRAEGGFGDTPLSRDACAAAAALLAQGERGAAKDLIRALARARESGGLADGLVQDLGRLITAFRAWTAEDAFLGRYQAGLAGLDRALPPRPVERPPPAPDSDQGVVAEVAERLWRLWPDAPAGGLHLAPMLQAGWSQMALLGLRVGATTADLRFQRSGTGYILKASRAHGPRLRLTVWLEDLPLTQVWIDEEPLGGRRAVFDLEGEHELRIEVG